MYYGNLLIQPIISLLEIYVHTSIDLQVFLCLFSFRQVSIGACGAIPPLVSLLITGSNRGKKDALTTLYKLCSAKVNKERAVSAGGEAASGAGGGAGDGDGREIDCGAE